MIKKNKTYRFLKFTFHISWIILDGHTMRQMNVVNGGIWTKGNTWVKKS